MGESAGVQKEAEGFSLVGNQRAEWTLRDTDYELEGATDAQSQSVRSRRS